MSDEKDYMSRERETSTLRQWLQDAGFDWKSGRIALQEYQRNEFDYYDDDASPVRAVFIDHNDPALDQKFTVGFGGVACPYFIAEDSQKTYFPGQYDGSTWCEVIWKDLSRYVGKDCEKTPVVGG